MDRVENESKVREPNIFFFAIGVNDAQFIHSTNSNRISDNDFEDNIKKLFEIAKKFTSKIIFVGLTPVDETKTKPIPWNTDKTYTNERISKFDKIIENFCSKNNLKFIPINDLLSNEDLIDGLHPNTQGHIKMFGKIKPDIEFTAKEKLEIVNFCGEAAHFCPATSEPREARRGNSVRAVLRIHRQLGNRQSTWSPY